MSVSVELTQIRHQSLTNIGIAITRPVDQTKQLSQLITAAGGNVITFPLIQIAALDDYNAFEKVIQEIANYDWLIFISSNAVQNSMPRLLNHGIPSQLRFAAIGPTTAESLKSFGVNEVLIPKVRFDSESLLSLPDMLDMHGKRVMLVRGIGGRDVLANTLVQRGAIVTFAECYQRVNPQTNCDVLAHAFAQQQLHRIVVTSSEAMRFLLNLAGDADWLKQVTICVNHARIAEEPLKRGLTVKIASSSGDEAMLTILA